MPPLMRDPIPCFGWMPSTFISKYASSWSSSIWTCPPAPPSDPLVPNPPLPPFPPRPPDVPKLYRVASSQRKGREDELFDVIKWVLKRAFYVPRPFFPIAPAPPLPPTPPCPPRPPSAVKSREPKTFKGTDFILFLV